MAGGVLTTEIGFASERGARERNEDYVGVFLGDETQRALRGVVAAVADGVGGSLGGRTAAELTVRGFVDGYYGSPETIGVERAAGRALDAMNRWVFAQGRLDPCLANMATTFSALIVRGREAHVVHVGDSRVYRWRDGRLARLTIDHTLRHPDLHHVLYRAVGIEDTLRIDHSVEPLRPDDRFVLCSDGVHGVLADRVLADLLLDPDSPQHAAERLVKRALEAGGRDNATALVVDVKQVPPIEAEELESTMATWPLGDLPAVGDVVDGFRLTAQLSNGRYNRLFAAVDTVEPREVVLKFPHPRVAGEAAARRAFIREGWIASRVRSPWLANAIDLPPGRQTRLYSVTPYYRGITLEQRLAAGPMTVEEGVRIGVELAKAVYALNRRQIIHRDVKPDNVMVCEGGGVKLFDLGAARLPGVPASESDVIPGTPSYMAPELLDGFAGDERSDVYALGVTLHRLFTGRYPYGEIEAFSRPRFHRRASPAQLRPDLPAWLDALLLRATAATADDRHQDAMELAFELEQGLAQGPVSKRRPRSLYERNPLLFWQITASLLALALLAALLSR
ncbi:MAG: protein kinase [Nitrospirota bacterium]